MSCGSGDIQTSEELSRRSQVPSLVIFPRIQARSYGEHLTENLLMTALVKLFSWPPTLAHLLEAFAPHLSNQHVLPARIDGMKYFHFHPAELQSGFIPGSFIPTAAAAMKCVIS